MPRGVASNKQLAMMTRVLDAFCVAHGITDPKAREEIGAVLLAIFNEGLRTEEELTTALRLRMPTIERSR